MANEYLDKLVTSGVLKAEAVRIVAHRLALIGARVEADCDLSTEPLGYLSCGNEIAQNSVPATCC